MGLDVKIDRAAAIQSLAKPAVVGAATVLFGPAGGAASLAAASVVDSPVGKVITDAVGSAVKVTEKDVGLQAHLAKAVEESLVYAFDSVEGENGRHISDELRTQVISSATSGSRVAVSDDGRAYLHAVMRQACIVCHDGTLTDDDLRGRVVEAYVGHLSEKMLEEGGVLYRTIMAEVIRSVPQKFANVSVGMGTLQENDARILEQLQQLSDGFSHGDRNAELVSEIVSVIRKMLDEHAAREAPGMPQSDGASRNAKLTAYYDYVYREFRDDNGSKLYGEIPLSECYIEPTVKEKHGEPQDMCEFIESWVDEGGAISVVCGEPGHGKTSLCRKAVWDFCTSGWLVGKVPNVLCFSLNPVGTDALDYTSFRFSSLFSWGGDRLDEDNRLRPKDCKDALVFLDGFDELLEWCPDFELGGFIAGFVSKFQRDTGAHVVITSRSMAVDPEASTYDVYDDGRALRVPILRMQPVSEERQLKWIGQYTEHFRQVAADDTGNANPEARENAQQMVAELERYLSRYRKLSWDSTLRDVLGVPVIFRMVCAARYVPKAKTTTAEIYDELFRVTWDRHRPHKEGQSMEGDKARLSRHAMKIYLDEEDTAVVDDFLRSPWSFSFYTTHEGGCRIGFLHRSFYQYFLAHEVMGWFRRYVRDGDADAFRSNLACLARRQLDKTTLGFIRDIHTANPERDSMDAAFDKAYAILKETDGFLPIPDSDEVDASHIKALAPSERARNVFCSVISACSACGSELTNDKLASSYPLRHYDMSGCNLSGAKLANANLEAACLMEADLNGADLKGASLKGASLFGASLVDTHLENADLREANLGRTVIISEHMEGTRLEGALIGEAHIMDTRHLKENMSLLLNA